MKAINPFQIFDLYKVLPGHGESSIKLTYERNHLTVDVFYDSINNKLDTLTFNFKNCISYNISSFPGISIYNNERGAELTLGSLVEYKKSDYADSWNEHFNNVSNVKHFSILFLEENVQLNVFADNVIYSTSNGNLS